MTDKQVNKKTFTLKDTFIANELNKRIIKFEDLKSKQLGYKIEMYSATELAEYFKNGSTPGSDSSINFIEFARNHAEKLKSQGRTSTANIMYRTINSLIDFCNGREKIGITEITTKFLTQYELFLRGKRTMKRKNQFGRMVTTLKNGLADVSVIDYMTDIRTLFNAAVDEFNDEDRDEIRIIHYPFRKYKIKKPPETAKRNLSAVQVQHIRSTKEQSLLLKRTIFARDVFMLSFYFAGTNLVDLYEAEEIKDGRLTYERKKTKNRRQDRAFISIKIEPEAADLIEKYRDKTGKKVFDFHNRYSTSENFNTGVNKGLKNVAKICKTNKGLTTYYARHSWATIARNKCGVSKDDVDLALNHIDQGLKMADVYIAKDWSIIDVANRKVLDHIDTVKAKNG